MPEQPAYFVSLDELRLREGWTLQLVAGNRERTVLNVLERAPEGALLSYTLGERQGQPWFMLVYGQYTSYDVAREAAGRLPAALGVGEPWVRSFKSY